MLSRDRPLGMFIDERSEIRQVNLVGFSEDDRGQVEPSPRR